MRKIKTTIGDVNFTAEIKKLSLSKKLMILGLDVNSQELLWNHAPAWEFLEDNIDRFTLYYVSEPSKLVEKRFAALPVNSRLPFSFCDVQSLVPPELQEDLIIFKETLMNEEFQW